MVHDVIPLTIAVLSLLALLAPSAHAQCSDPTVLSVDTTTSTAAAYDLFGYALVTADFDGDGYDDLGVGTPGRDVGGVTDAGQVTVFYGRSGGLSSAYLSPAIRTGLRASAADVGFLRGHPRATARQLDD